MPVELELLIIFNIVSTFILKTSSLPTTLEIGCHPPKYLQPDTWDSQHDELMGERGTRECFHENTFTKQWKMSEAANVYINSSGQWGQEADQGTQD